MKNTARSFLCASLLAAAIQLPAQAHAYLEGTVPPKDAVLVQPPADVSLHFNEVLEPGFSTISVVDATGKSVLSAKASPDTTDGRVLRAAFGSLGAGKYTVAWVAVGRDGHRRTGSYMFSVK